MSIELQNFHVFFGTNFRFKELSAVQLLPPHTPEKRKKNRKRKKEVRERLFCETGKPLLNIILLKALLLFGYAGIASFCLKVSLELRCVFGGTSCQAGSRFVFVRQFIFLRHIWMGIHEFCVSYKLLGKRMRLFFCCILFLWSLNHFYMHINGQGS